MHNSTDAMRMSGGVLQRTDFSNSLVAVGQVSCLIQPPLWALGAVKVWVGTEANGGLLDYGGG